jgi:hypothetical protein
MVARGLGAISKAQPKEGFDHGCAHGGPATAGKVVDLRVRELMAKDGSKGYSEALQEVLPADGTLARAGRRRAVVDLSELDVPDQAEARAEREQTFRERHGAGELGDQRTANMNL